ncbi:MAG: glycosyltransferase family 2 protein [Chitinophagales bacterium]|nr:glycosyltransferase family 2 protein [Chitinophagales bacterium]HMV15487.1 glycosyltransferase family 2 protein [Chitinophagales bacterium]HMW11591.1 glycosyltransferase family 2 protein [Chitinophagales bacterium]HMY24058.1 glycosyltransferase family 2 protein [Chitinophagales bacterium]HMZ32626.1 glycosyltransferase family 2 protein [Chitinophagales bacterium]
MEISVVIPVFNEEANLPLLHERLVNAVTSCSNDYEFIFVNDGSTDKSLQIIRDLAARFAQVKYIDFSKNFGHQLAVFAGLEHATGEYIVIIDADLQDPPELIQELYAKIKTGFDVVYAQRETRVGESWHKRFTAKLFYRFINTLSDVAIPLDTGDYRILTKRIKDIVVAMPERNKFLRGQIAWTGFNQSSVMYKRDERYSGKSNYSYTKMFSFAIDGITAFSNLPLRLATYLGFLVSLISFFVILYTLYQKYINHNVVQGWSSLMVSVMFIGGVQLICLGIIGEYLSRILDNVKQRPLYIVRDSNL